MKVLSWGIRILIPVAVLYTIGYYVPGFSALTIPWILILSVLITVGDWIIQRVIPGKSSLIGRGIINFLISAVVIFTVTMAIEGGNVPLGGALLAALIIGVLTMAVLSQMKERI